MCMHFDTPTVNGWFARLYTTNAGGEYPIHGSVYNPEVGIFLPPTMWDKNGINVHDAKYDLKMINRELSLQQKFDIIVKLLINLMNNPELSYDTIDLIKECLDQVGVD